MSPPDLVLKSLLSLCRVAPNLSRQIHFAQAQHPGDRGRYQYVMAELDAMTAILREAKEHWVGHQPRSIPKILLQKAVEVELSASQLVLVDIPVETTEVLNSGIKFIELSRALLSALPGNPTTLPDDD